MAYTEGTISEALPPSTSALVSSFLAPHNPHVKGSALTNGARALAKHINRSSDKYWGDFCGSGHQWLYKLRRTGGKKKLNWYRYSWGKIDSDKNKAALDVIGRFIIHCCWMNMHVVPPHGTVFEIRVAEGFGARWSEDGSKFLGFLEPYMVDGHSRGWRH